MFAGEPFLRVKLPNYEGESFITVGWLIAATIFWSIVAPLFFMKTEETSTSEAANGNQKERIRITKGSGRKKTQKATPPSARIQQSEQTSATKVAGEQPVRYIPFQVNLLACSGLFYTFVFILMKSPYNAYTPRRVFQAPLLTVAECETILAMADAAAKLNYEAAKRKPSKNETSEALLREPHGWQKNRHGSYPTTDLNLVTDPFTREDRKFLTNLLDRRLAPLISRVYGIPERAIRANDMFVVRYDAPDENDSENSGKRARLANHTDSEDVSFNILLNNDFEGGGTRFWERVAAKPFAHVQPTSPGTVLLNSALINHEGFPITKGSRIILVGFLSVDRIDPFTREPTGLSAFASWLSLSWMQRTLKDAYMMTDARFREIKDDGSLASPPPPSAGKWTDAVYVRMLFRDFFAVLEMLGDVFGTHIVEDLVAEQEKDLYLQALDQAPRKGGGATWWKGQQIRLNRVEGTHTEWTSRAAMPDAFHDLEL